MDISALSGCCAPYRYWLSQAKSHHCPDWHRRSLTFAQRGSPPNGCTLGCAFPSTSHGSDRGPTPGPPRGLFPFLGASQGEIFCCYSDLLSADCNPGQRQRQDRLPGQTSRFFSLIDLARYHRARRNRHLSIYHYILLHFAGEPRPGAVPC